MGLLASALGDLGLRREDVPGADHRLRPPVPLEAVLPVGRLAEEAVRFADLMARMSGAAAAPLDPVRIATSFTSDRHFRLDGQAPDAWAPLSGFWPTADGWIRTHANYPHHRRALLDALGIRDADDSTAKTHLEQSLAGATALEAEERIVALGGVAGAVRTEAQWRAHPHGSGAGSRPLLAVRERGPGSVASGVGGGAPGDAAPRQRTGAGWGPLDGVRVLDLTRVLAGPICTRTLAHWGADVLRIDPPFLSEPGWIHLDTGPGKRSALLDLRADRNEFERLLDAADVLVHGYRPGALAALGMEELIRERPRLLVASLSAWGPGPWAGRRGFDSIVQAATGIAMAESADESRPGVLPAQALDHSAGYLLAGAVAHLLRRRAEHGGSWSVDTSLARIAHELLTMPRAERGAGASFAPTVATIATAAGSVTLARPALGPEDYRAAPHPFGTDPPQWAPSRAARAGDG